jgi:hypothetical protein
MRLLPALLVLLAMGTGCSTPPVARLQYGRYENKIIVDGPSKRLEVGVDGLYSARMFEYSLVDGSEINVREEAGRWSLHGDELILQASSGTTSHAKIEMQDESPVIVWRKDLFFLKKEPIQPPVPTRGTGT